MKRRHENSGITDIPVATRSILVDATVSRLKDKAMLVRRRAIELLTTFIQTSPFIAILEDEGTLSREYFEKRVKNLNDIIKVIIFHNHRRLNILMKYF